MTAEEKNCPFVWAGNSLVAKDRSIFTVFPNGKLEIRGKGWEGRKRKGDTPMTDRPRICSFPSEKAARKFAELVAEIL